MSRHLVSTSLLVALAATAGCGADDLPPGSFLDRDRVLGARVEVADDPSRASPVPGEAATVRWIVSGPAAPAPQPWTLGVCAGTFAGCTSAPFQLDRGESVAPRISFTAPAADELGDATVVWIAGEIGESAVLARVPLALDGVERANRNPSLAGATLALGGAPWTALDPQEALPPEGCAGVAGGASLPVIRAADGELALTLDVPEPSRERYAAVAADGTTDTRRETLQVSHFTSVGSLDRQYSVIEADASAATIDVAWLAPDEVAGELPAGGALARFVFVVRDGRGGVDATTRLACVVP